MIRNKLIILLTLSAVMLLPLCSCTDLRLTNSPLRKKRKLMETKIFNGQHEDGTVAADEDADAEGPTLKGLDRDSLLDFIQSGEEVCPLGIPEEDFDGCEVPMNCQCGGIGYEGCTQCVEMEEHGFSTGCVMVNENLSVCSIIPAEKNPKRARRGCVVEDYEQCGGNGYVGCQRCKKNSKCSFPREDADHDEMVCIPKRAAHRARGRAGLDDDRVRNVARKFRGIDDRLDLMADDETSSLTTIRKSMPRAFATEKGMRMMKELSMAGDPEYEAIDVEVSFVREELCSVAENPASAFSAETRDCLCGSENPSLYCVAMASNEFEDFVSARRMLQVLEGKEDDGGNLPFDLEGIDTEELKQVFQEARLAQEQMEYEQKLEEAWHAVEDSLLENPDFHGDVEESIFEARRVLERALKEVYDSDAYDFSEFDGGMGPFHRDLASCSLTAQGVGSSSSQQSGAVQFFTYANAVIDFITTGQGCVGIECAIPVPATPLEVTIAVNACLTVWPTTIPNPTSITFTTINGWLLPQTLDLYRYQYAQGIDVSLSIALCLIGGSNDTIQTILAFLGIDLCFVEGGMGIRPLLGNIYFYVVLSLGPAYASAYLTLLYDEAVRDELGVCGSLTNIIKTDCRLCEGGYYVQFAIGLDLWFWNPEANFGPITVPSC